MSSNKTIVRRFDGMGSFIAALPVKSEIGAEGRDWTANESYHDSLRLCRDGWKHIVPKAEAMLDEIETSDLLTPATPSYMLDVAGFNPCVPAFLANDPACMYRRAVSSAASETAPLSIYVCAAASGSLSADTLKSRGIAILTLVLALSRVRPIELFVYWEGSGTKCPAFLPVVSIDTGPLDLSSATYALASAGFLRNLCFAWGEPYGFHGGFAWGSRPDQPDHQRRIRDVLGAREHDLVLYGASATDPLARDPMAWVKAQLKLHAPQSAD